MLVILTSRFSQITDWLVKNAGFKIVESQWETMDGSAYDKSELWSTSKPTALTNINCQSLETLTQLFPNLAQWMKPESNHTFLWLATINGSNKEDLRRALVDEVGEIFVMGLFYGHSKSFTCRVTDQLTATSDALLPRYKSCRLVKAHDSTVDRSLKIQERNCPNRVIYLSRHGESEFNVLGKVGGDADLSPRGQKYARCLGQYVNRMLIDACQSRPLKVWTSTLKRTIQTARWIRAERHSFGQLNELGSGVCDGMTYEEIADRYPAEFAARDADKFHYRYPGGESYADLLQRVRPIIEKLEKEDRVLVIAHQAVIRCLLAALLGKDDQELPYIHTPLHTLMRLEFTPVGVQLQMHPLSVECVDTQRARPENVSVNRTVEEALMTVPAHYNSTSVFAEPENVANI